MLSRIANRERNERGGDAFNGQGNDRGLSRAGNGREFGKHRRHRLDFLVQVAHIDLVAIRRRVVHRFDERALRRFASDAAILDKQGEGLLDRNGGGPHDDVVFALADRSPNVEETIHIVVANGQIPVALPSIQPLFPDILNVAEESGDLFGIELAIAPAKRVLHPVIIGQFLRVIEMEVAGGGVRPVLAFGDALVLLLEGFGIGAKGCESSSFENLYAASVMLDKVIFHCVALSDFIETVLLSAEITDDLSLGLIPRLRYRRL